MNAPESMVMAIGDSGRAELCRESETVEIPSVPLADGNLVIPATLRWSAKGRGRDPAATKLTRIRMPNVKDDRPFVLIEFDVAPFVRYTTDAGPVMGTSQSCYVRDISDTLDPIFDRLCVRERDRILRAVRRAARARGVSA